MTEYCKKELGQTWLIKNIIFSKYYVKCVIYMIPRYIWKYICLMFLTGGFIFLDTWDQIINFLEIIILNLLP